MRQRDPTVTMAAILDRNGLEDIITYLVDRKAARLFGEQLGLHVDETLVAKEIAKIPVQAPDGTIDPAAYARFLADRRQTDAEFRAEVAEMLMARQLLGSTETGVFVPKKVTLRYAGMVMERRKGAIALLPSAAFAPKTPPTETEITEWYNSHKADYLLPERRTICLRRVRPGSDQPVPAPTDAEIAARYNAVKATRFAPTDKRKLSQLVLPTEAAAKQVMADPGRKSLKLRPRPRASRSPVGFKALNTHCKAWMQRPMRSFRSHRQGYRPLQGTVGVAARAG